MQFYPQISGIFFDQQSSRAQDLDFYITIRDYARKRITNPLVVDNPGTLCDETYFSHAVSDVICVFAGFEGFDNLLHAESLKKEWPTQLAALTYEIGTVQEMRRVLSESVVKRIDYLYISDAVKGDNPWGRLPAYWDEEVEAVRQAN